MADLKKPDEFPTVIGADAQFKGELSFQGSVRIDGQFEGGIKTPGTVYVSQSGKVKAEISAGSVSVDGEIEGNIVSDGRVEMNATGKLTGDLKAAKLLVKEGACINGKCEVGPGVGSARVGAPAAEGASSAGGAMRQITAAATGKR